MSSSSRAAMLKLKLKERQNCTAADEKLFAQTRHTALSSKNIFADTFVRDYVQDPWETLQKEAEKDLSKFEKKLAEKIKKYIGKMQSLRDVPTANNFYCAAKELLTKAQALLNEKKHSLQNIILLKIDLCDACYSRKELRDKNYQDTAMTAEEYHKILIQKHINDYIECLENKSNSKQDDEINIGSLTSRFQSLLKSPQQSVSTPKMTGTK